jgi:hypothetical protein
MKRPFQIYKKLNFKWTEKSVGALLRMLEYSLIIWEVGYFLEPRDTIVLARNFETF